MLIGGGFFTLPRRKHPQQRGPFPEAEEITLRDRCGAKQSGHDFYLFPASTPSSLDDTFETPKLNSLDCGNCAILEDVFGRPGLGAGKFVLEFMTSYLFMAYTEQELNCILIEPRYTSNLLGPYYQKLGADPNLNFIAFYDRQSKILGIRNLLYTDKISPAILYEHNQPIPDPDGTPILLRTMMMLRREPFFKILVRITLKPLLSLYLEGEACWSPSAAKVGGDEGGEEGGEEGGGRGAHDAIETQTSKVPQGPQSSQDQSGHQPHQ